MSEPAVNGQAPPTRNREIPDGPPDPGGTSRGPPGRGPQQRVTVPEDAASARGCRRWVGGTLIMRRAGSSIHFDADLQREKLL